MECGIKNICLLQSVQLRSSISQLIVNTKEINITNDLTSVKGNEHINLILESIFFFETRMVAA
jgi:hypothetical protein